MRGIRERRCSLWGRFDVFSLLMTIVTICYAGSLNVYEVNKITYDFDISNIPIGFDNIDLSSIHSVDDHHITSLLSKLKETKESDESVLIVTNENGQKFECGLPIVKEVRDNNDNDNLNESLLTQNIVSDVLSAAFYVRNCLKKNFGWWTYELCFGKYIHQLHYEGSNIVHGPISLGNYSDDAEITETKSNLKSNQQLYFEQHYTNGSICELIGKPRVTTVKYECDEMLSTNEAYLDEVDEQSTCRYVIKVKVGSLCKLDAFKPSASVNSLQHPTAVVCRPLLEQHQAITFIHSLINRHRHKMLVQKQIDELMENITSLKRQLKLHKRAALISPFSKNKYSKFNKKLQSRLDTLHKTLTQLISEVEGIKIDKSFVVDDEDDEIEVNMQSEWDKDRESLYWYFKDVHFDRSFFPATIQYVRAKNIYYLKLSSYYNKLGESFDDSLYPYARFISDVDSGRISELDLSIILGPLKEIFDEHLVPGVVPNQISITKAVPLFENMFKSEETINNLIGAFQKSVMSFLVEQLDNTDTNKIIDSRDVISKCSRQLLKIRALMANSKDASVYSYVATENIYLKFEKAYNDAVEHVWRSKGLFDNTVDVPFYSDRDIVDDSDDYNILDGEDSDDSKLGSSDDKLIDGGGHERTVDINNRKITSQLKNTKQKRQEYFAGLRMRRRAKRMNLRRKVERYFRRASAGENKEKAKIRTSEEDNYNLKNTVKMQLQFFTKTIEEQLRETGITEEVKIHLITTNDNMDWIDNRLNSLIDAFIDEQKWLNEERDKYNRMVDAYNFDVNMETNEGIDGSNKRDVKEERDGAFLPILRRVIV